MSPVRRTLATLVAILLVTVPLASAKEKEKEKDPEAWAEEHGYCLYNVVEAPHVVSAPCGWSAQQAGYTPGLPIKPGMWISLFGQCLSIVEYAPYVVVSDCDG